MVDHVSIHRAAHFRKRAKATAVQILTSGHSRIPVHAPGNPTDYIGMLSEWHFPLERFSAR